MEKVLVTGGAGYIGSKISYDLTDAGYKVFIIDNLINGHKKLINPKAQFFRISISNVRKIKKIIEKYKIKNIIHCAAFLNVEESGNQKKKYYKNNVLGTVKLLKACNIFIDNFIFSSTCAVYNTSKNPIVSENSNIGPKSYYGKTKYKCEELIKKYSKKYKFKYAILRYFNVGGSDEKLRCGCINSTNQLIKNLSINIVRKKYKINLFGNNYKTNDGTCIRDYIHVSDLSRLHILTLKFLFNKKKSLILNCGCGRGYSVLEIIKSFEKIIKRKIQIIVKEKRRGDIDQIFSINNKIKKKLNINFKFKTISEILKSSLSWEKKIYEKK